MSLKKRNYDVQFIKTALLPEDYPEILYSDGQQCQEVAFVGRSNVGKSSLLNHLLNRKKIARVSSSPGKTQMLNFFLVDKKYMFVDLPGYGYAKVPKALKEKWGIYLENYLKTRENLKLILLLLDLRHPPTKDDIMMFNWLQHHHIPILLVLTKADKLKPRHIKTHVDVILENLSAYHLSYTPYSIYDDASRDNLINQIEHVIHKEKE